MEKILIISPLGIGNFLLTLPLIHLLNGRYKVDVLIREYNLPIAKRYPLLIDKIIIFEDYFIRDLLKVLKSKYHTIYYVFPGNWTRMLILVRLARSKYKIGYKMNSNFFYKSLPNFKKLPLKTYHESVLNARLYDESVDKDVVLNLYKEIKLVKTDSLNKTKRILIHPGSDNGTLGILKRYPIKKWNILLDELLIRYVDYSISIILGPKELEEKHKFIQNDRIRFYSDSLENLIDFISCSTILIGNDSGIAHLASFCGIPVVTLFGPVDDKKSRPLFNSYPINKKLECSPCQSFSNQIDCVNSIYKNCMVSITSKNIIGVIDKIIL